MSKISGVVAHTRRRWDECRAKEIRTQFELVGIRQSVPVFDVTSWNGSTKNHIFGRSKTSADLRIGGLSIVVVAYGSQGFIKEVEKGTYFVLFNAEIERIDQPVGVTGVFTGRWDVLRPIEDEAAASEALRQLQRNFAYDVGIYFPAKKEMGYTGKCEIRWVPHFVPLPMDVRQLAVYMPGGENLMYPAMLRAAPGEFFRRDWI